MTAFPWSILVILMCPILGTSVTQAPPLVWNWVGGSPTQNALVKSPGQLGVYSPTNSFGSSDVTNAFSGPNGSVVVVTMSQGTNGLGIWSWDPVSKQLTVRYAVPKASPAVYGPLGVFNASFTPGPRSAATLGYDVARNGLWLYAGTGSATNDLWFWNATSRFWGRIAGTKAASNIVPSAGILGVASASNTPGSREGYNKLHVDPTGHLWLYGGALGSTTGLADLWNFNTSSLLWTWLGGSISTSISPTYGPPGVPSATTQPGARLHFGSVMTKSGVLYLYGGWARSTNHLGDLLRIDVTVWSKSGQIPQWAWIGGTSDSYTTGFVQQPYMFPRRGLRGFASPNNFPGCRQGMALTYDEDRQVLYLMGGATILSPLNTTINMANDLWSWTDANPATNSAGGFAWLSGSTRFVSSPQWPISKGTNGPSANNVTASENLPPRFLHGFVYEPGTKSLVLMAGTGDAFKTRFLADIWVLNRTSTCSCPALSVCVDKSGSFECMPYVVPGTLSRSVAAASIGGDLVSFLLATPTPGATIKTVSYGTMVQGFSTSGQLSATSASIGLDRFSCSGLQLQVLNATHTKATCTLAAGLGNDLTIGVTSCCASAEYGCFTTRSTAASGLLGYPTPTIAAGSLQFNDPLISAESSSFPSHDIALTSSLPVTIAFAATNVLNLTEFISIRYGPAGDSLKYLCIVNVAKTTSSRIVCTTQLASQGIGLRFSILMATSTSPTKVVAQGTDTINFVTTPPIVRGVAGCSDNKNETKSCATAGGQRLIVTGQGFYEPTKVLVNGRDCTVIRPTQSNRVICTLQPGVGTGQPVVVVSAGLVSAISSSVTVSYARPMIAKLEATGCTKSSSNGNLTLINCQPTATTILTLTGSSFGTSGASVFVATQQCAQVVHDPTTPQTVLRCFYLPQAIGVQFSVQVLQANGQLSLSSATVGYPQCQAGTFARVLSATTQSCTACDKGYFSVAPGQSACSRCDLGRFANTTGSTNCFLCGKGTFAGQPASSECSDCGVGRFSRSTQSINCDLVPAGQFADVNGTIEPTPCSAGRFSSSSGSSTCTDCPVGSIAPSQGATACQVCAAGKTNLNNPKAASCSSCDAGTYSSQPGSTSCSACSEGFVAPSADSTQCRLCVAGKFSINSSLECHQCAPGRFAANAAQTLCSACTAGRFAASSGSTTCALCPDNAFSASASANCTVCQDNAARSATDINNGVCICNTGFYATVEGNCFKCPAEADACVGGKILNSAGSFVMTDSVTGEAEIVTCPRGRCDANQNCTANRQPYGPSNPLCGTCLDGFTEMNGVCIACSAPNGGFIVLVIVLSWLFVLGSHRLAQQTNGFTKLFILFVQSMLVIVDDVHKAFSWLSIFNLSPNKSVGSVCILPLTPYEQVGAPILLPLLFFGQLLLTAGLHKLLSLSTFKTFQAFSTLPYKRTLVVLVLSSYLTIASGVLAFLNCVPVGSNGQAVVFSVPAIDCSAANAKYSAWRLVAILFLAIILVALPMAGFGFIMYNRKAIRQFNRDNKTKIKSKLPSPISSSSSVSQASWILPLAPLYEAYRPDRVYMEGYMVVRRLVLLAIQVGLARSARWQATAYIILHLALLVMQYWMQPFQLVIENKLEALNLLTLIVISALIGTGPTPFSPALEAVLSILVLGMTFGLVFYYAMEQALDKGLLKPTSWLGMRWGRLRQSKYFNRPTGLNTAGRAADKEAKRTADQLQQAQAEADKADDARIEMCVMPALPYASDGVVAGAVDAVAELPVDRV